MDITLSILSFLLIIFSGVSEAIMDKLNFHFEKSIFSNEKYKQIFWNPIESWKNKWKEDLKTERFLGSSTIFVFTTDAWHLFKFFRNTSLFIGLGLLGFISYNPIIMVIIARVLYGLSFTLLFDKILVKK
jgi:hypothetical protein